MSSIVKETIVEYLKENVPELHSTHKILCFPIINRLYKKMKMVIRFSAIKVVDNIIIDGHHRYVASLLAQIELDRTPYQTTSAKSITEWKSIEFVDEDWDTNAKILFLNQQDAEYSGIAMEEIIRCLK